MNFPIKIISSSNVVYNSEFLMNQKNQKYFVSTLFDKDILEAYQNTYSKSVKHIYKLLTNFNINLSNKDVFNKYDGISLLEYHIAIKNSAELILSRYEQLYKIQNFNIYTIADDIASHVVKDISFMLYRFLDIYNDFNIIESYFYSKQVNNFNTLSSNSININSAAMRILDKFIDADGKMQKYIETEVTQNAAKALLSLCNYYVENNLMNRG